MHSFFGPTIVSLLLLLSCTFAFSLSDKKAARLSIPDFDLWPSRWHYPFTDFTSPSSPSILVVTLARKNFSLGDLYPAHPCTLFARESNPRRQP